METGGLVQVAWSVRGGASVVPAGARDDLWGGANADDVANILFTHDERSCARGGRLLDGPPRCDLGQPFTDVGEASAIRHDRSYCNDRTPLICKDGNRMQLGMVVSRLAVRFEIACDTYVPPTSPDRECARGFLAPSTYVGSTSSLDRSTTGFLSFFIDELHRCWTGDRRVCFSTTGFPPTISPLVDGKGPQQGGTDQASPLSNAISRLRRHACGGPRRLFLASRTHTPPWKQTGKSETMQVRSRTKTRRMRTCTWRKTQTDAAGKAMVRCGRDPSEHRRNGGKRRDRASECRNGTQTMVVGCGTNAHNRAVREHEGSKRPPADEQPRVRATTDPDVGVYDAFRCAREKEHERAACGTSEAFGGLHAKARGTRARRGREEGTRYRRGQVRPRRSHPIRIRQLQPGLLGRRLGWTREHFCR
eukprot:scaffold346_cov347-Pavlova_lutheri.AAC.16